MFNTSYLDGPKGYIFDKNVARMLDFVKARQNPFVVTTSPVTLHNFVTSVAVNDAIKERLPKARFNGEKVYQSYRNERVVLKITNIWV